MAEPSALKRPVSGAPARPDARLERRMARLLVSVWYGFADPVRLAWLAGTTAAGLGVGIVARQPGALAGLELAARRNVLVERVYAFLELHDPLGSWWMALLVAATALAVVATAVEHHGALALRLGAGTPGKPRRSPDPAPRAIRRAAAALGPDARIGLGIGTASASGATDGLRRGVMLLAVGALIVLAGGGVERLFGVSGEILLRTDEVMDRVQVPGPLGSVQTRPLGFSVTVSEIGGDGVRASRSSGSELVLPMGETVQVGGMRLETRLTRPIAGGEHFVVAVVDRESGERVVETLSRNQAIPVPGDGPAPYQLTGYQLDLRGLGPAIRVESTGVGASEAFWVFERRPEFDRENRAGRYALELVEVRPRMEAIVAAVRHPGLPVILAGGAVMLLGLLLSFTGARGTRVVRIAGGRIVGAPGDDEAVRRAVDAAAGPEKKGAPAGARAA
jgi:hypothetical protein